MCVDMDGQQKMEKEEEAVIILSRCCGGTI